jgi:DNA-binding beta-propeller fold protein YncE
VTGRLDRPGGQHAARPGRRPLARRGSLLLVATLLGAACSGGKEPAKPRTDVPEPAAAPAAAADLPGRVVPLPGQPEGLVWDTTTGTIAAAVRAPDALALLDAATGRLRLRVPLAGAARHLQLAGPGGPVLVPSEGNDRLYRVALPGGELTADAPVGRQPHDAAPAEGARVFVGDELADSVHVVAADGSSQVFPAPAQPGGVAASADGSVVAVVGVRGRRIAAYRADGRQLGEAACGVGPTHVRAGAGGLFYVADTQGGMLLVYETGAYGIRQVAQVPTSGGAPYGLAVDAGRSRLFVTLTASNQLRSYRIAGATLTADRTWATVRQPNDVAVDAATGQVAVAGTADGVLQLLDPAE